MDHKQNWPILKILHLGGHGRINWRKVAIKLHFFRDGEHTLHLRRILVASESKEQVGRTDTAEECDGADTNDEKGPTIPMEWL